MDKFKENLSGIIQNLPLMLSDSKDVSDISMNKVLIFVEFMLLFLVSPPLMCGVFLFKPELFDKLSNMWVQGLAAFGTHFTLKTGANVFNNYIGSNNNTTK